MWKYEDEKMFHENMWRWEDEKMFHRPPLLEEPCAQTLSGKTETDSKTTPEQILNQHSIDPKTTRKKHQSSTKFTPQQL